MNTKTEIHLQLGTTGQDFERFWSGEVAAGEIPAEIRAEFRPGGRPPGGLGLTAPPEVIIWFVKGAAGAIGAGIGTLLWNKLKAFFEKSPPASVPKEAVFIIVNSRAVFDPRNMSIEPPLSLKQLDG
jgi:hypothetical protein